MKRLMDIVEVWLCVYYDIDECMDSKYDIEETEVIVKKYEHNKNQKN